MQKFLDTVLGLTATIAYLLLIMGAFVIIPRIFARLRRTKPRDRKQRSIRQYLKQIGPTLRRRYGSKPHYTVAQVRETLNSWGYDGGDYDCYALAMYCNELDFNEYYRSIGETCNYDLMRGEVVNYFDLIFDGNTAFNAEEAIDYGDRIDNASEPNNSNSDSGSWFDFLSFDGGSADGGGSDFGGGNFGGGDCGGGD